MAIVGTIEQQLCTTVSTAAQGTQECFVALYNFLANPAGPMRVAGHTSLHASYFGNGSAAGFGFWDQVNPAGENAWFVVKFQNSSTPFYLLAQWADSENFGLTGGSPGLIQGVAAGDGLGLDMALRANGTSPWNGTTDADGADTKGTPVWSAGVSNLHTLNRSNASGGSFSTNKQNTARSIGEVVTAGTALQIHMLGNEDGVLILWDLANNGGYSCTYLGKYQTLPELDVDFPYVAIIDSVASGSAISWSSTGFGTTAGTSTREGGIIGANTSNSTKQFVFDVGGPFQLTAFEPNNQFASPTHNTQSFFLFQNETIFGCPGYISPELISMIFNTANLDTNAAGTRAYMGTTVTAAVKWCIPWSGAAPGAGTTRAGRAL